MCTAATANFKSNISYVVPLVLNSYFYCVFSSFASFVKTKTFLLVFIV